MDTNVKKKSGLATAGMVLGIIAIVLAFIPIINNAAFVLGVLALIFGIIPLVKKRSIGKAVTAVVLGILSIVITIAMQAAFSKAIDDATAPTKTNSAASQSKNDDTAKPKEAVFDGATAYKKITTGMTKSQVRKITGVDPGNCSVTEDPTFGKVETCDYGNMFKDKVWLSVTYEQDKVSDKSKFTN